MDNGKQYDQHKVEQGITTALEAFKLLGLTPLEIFQAARSISLGVAAKAKVESGRREL
ncbi:MAG: hypothetical protein ACLT00_02035 [Collinsella sp.]